MKGIMKEVIILAIMVTIFFAGSVFGRFTYKANLYPMTAKIVNISKATNKVTVEDFNGNLWEFKGIEDWSVGDIASCMMYDNHTKDTIEDDEIVDVHYGGWFDGWKERKND